MFEMLRLKFRHKVLCLKLGRHYRYLDTVNNKSEPRRASGAGRQLMEVARLVVEMDKLSSSRVCWKAYALAIDKPDGRDEEYWKEPPSFYENKEKYLTPKGVRYLESLIDAEKTRRFEAKTLWVTKFWLPLVASLVAIIGALTGLVAVLQHRK
jgi:hypothetical protein